MSLKKPLRKLKGQPTANPVRGRKDYEAALIFRERYENGSQLTKEKLVQVGTELFPENAGESASFYAGRLTRAACHDRMENPLVVWMQGDGTYIVVSPTVANQSIDLEEIMARKMTAQLSRALLYVEGIPWQELTEIQQFLVLELHNARIDAVEMVSNLIGSRLDNLSERLAESFGDGEETGGLIVE